MWQEIFLFEAGIDTSVNDCIASSSAVLYFFNVMVWSFACRKERRIVYIGINIMYSVMLCLA